MRSLRIVIYCFIASLLACAPARAANRLRSAGRGLFQFPGPLGARSGGLRVAAANGKGWLPRLELLLSAHRQRRRAVVWLKNQVTVALEVFPAAVSGVKGAGVLERKSGPVEFSIDRTGGDFTNMDVKTDATGAVCARQACEAEQRCAAAPGLMCGRDISRRRRAAS